MTKLPAPRKAEGEPEDSEEEEEEKEARHSPQFEGGRRHTPLPAGESEIIEIREELGLPQHPKPVQPPASSRWQWKAKEAETDEDIMASSLQLPISLPSTLGVDAILLEVGRMFWNRGKETYGSLPELRNSTQK